MTALNVAVSALLERDPSFVADPYPTYAMLREAAPVCPSSAGWLLTRYADVDRVLSDARCSTNRNGGDRRQRLYARHSPDDHAKIDAVIQSTSLWMLNSDPPTHSRLRAAAKSAFSSSATSAMKRAIEGLVGGYLDKISRSGALDIIDDFARPLSTDIFARLMGTPGEDARLLTKWSDGLAQYLDGGRDVILAHECITEFNAYLRAHVAARGAAPRDDLINSLWEDGNPSGGLTEDEVLAMCGLLLLAQHETTTNLIGNAVLRLLQHPDQLELLRGEPERIGRAVEECLRFDSPVHTVKRVCLEPIEVGGHRIAAGEVVIPVLAAANRDPARFFEPDRLDITRHDTRHLSFGQGPHFCLGAMLARLEAQTAIAEVFRRFPTLALADEPLEWRSTLALRGLKSLHVEFMPDQPRSIVPR